MYKQNQHNNLHGNMRGPTFFPVENDRLIVLFKTIVAPLLSIATQKFQQGLSCGGQKRKTHTDIGHLVVT